MVTSSDTVALQADQASMYIYMAKNPPEYLEAMKTPTWSNGNKYFDSVNYFRLKIKIVIKYSINIFNCLSFYLHQVLPVGDHSKCPVFYATRKYAPSVQFVRS